MAEARALKRLVKSLGIIKTQVQTFTVDTCISDINTCIDLLADEWKEYQLIEKSVKGKFDDAHVDTVDKIEANHFEIKQKLIKWQKLYEVNSVQGRQGNNSMEDLLLNQSNFIQEISTMNRRENEVRLPRVNIPVFSGAYSEFPSFRDLFETSIHDNASISKVHKLQYLKGLLKGEAYALINHIAVTEANYDQVWEKMKARFDKKKHVVHSLLKQFMEQPTVLQSSAKAIRHLSDVSDEVLRGLKVLGENAESRDPWLIFILLNKLDAATKEAWAHETASIDLPTLDQFFMFLNKRSDALECLGSSQKSKPVITKKVGTMVSQTANNGGCSMCEGDHYIGRCEKFLELSVPQRKELVAQKRLCFNCLSTTHQAIVCRSRYTCRTCRRKHHITLHMDQNPNITAEDQSEQGTSQSIQTSTSCQSSVYIPTKLSGCPTESFQAILPTAIISVEDKFGQMWKCRALLDSGSQSSFISESCARRLNLKREKANVRITGVTSGNLTSSGKSTIILESVYDHDVKLSLEVLIIKKLPAPLPKRNIYHADEELLKNIELADPQFDKPASLDLLIGADKFFEILDGEQKRSNSLILQKTIFGWIVSGQPLEVEEQSSNTFSLQAKEELVLENTLRKFWEIEDLPSTSSLSPEEMECEDLFVNTHQRAVDGRYIVKLPFRKQSQDLGDSIHAAAIRFRALERKFSLNPNLKGEYVKQIQDYIRLGHMVEVPEHILQRYSNNNSYYLPHHSVTKEQSTTTKVRVVFDGSSKTSTGVSLNNKLMIGPTIQPTLWTTLLRFRSNKVALVADVEKMYRQVIVSEEHRSFQTILWRENPDQKMRHYQLTRVSFGLACSAFLAIRSLQQLALESSDEEVKKCLLNDFYVDDLLSGTYDINHAHTLRDKLSKVLASGGFILSRWRSNLSCLSENKDNSSIMEICCENMSPTKALGLLWHPREDIFSFDVHAEKDGAVNKRKIISESSRLFDPLGFLSPSIIILKILFQKLWLLKLDWDDNLPREYEEEYQKTRNQFKHFERLQIKRFTNFNGEIQIHGFADASEAAYCAVIYSRTVTMDGQTICQLLTSKTKVAPLKKVSLPRLELCASHLLVKLMSAVRESLQIDAKYFAWTDSKIVLAWLSTYPGRWKTFVANRTSQILEKFPRKHWAHVQSQDNPADYGSRGVSPEKLIDLEQWWKGPAWLGQDQICWPTSIELANSDANESDMEYSNTNNHTTILHTKCEPETNSWMSRLLEKNFKLPKLFRIVAYVIRFIDRKIAKRSGDLNASNTTQLTTMEIKRAKLVCIKWVQQEVFKEDYRNIQRNNRVNSQSRLLPLAPFIDGDGVLRVGGRLQNSDCDFNSKHPIILPQKHIFTDGVIWDIHLSNLHSGPTLTSNIIRQNYWVLNGRSRIRRIIKDCVICVRYAAKATTQFMGNLPAARVNPTRPFENCGIDFAGPIYITSRKGRGNKPLIKGYICIFVCLSVKAIHIEGVTDLTSEAFLAALRRFTSRRGLPKNIYTDNGSNFVGARRILDKACKLIKNINNDYVIAEYLTQNQIEWHFIPPSSPHFGGLWEAAVKSVKTHLLKATHNINLTFEEMNTLLCQIESILNSRPLCTSTSDDEYQVLTPAHFLIGTSTGTIVEQTIDEPENRLARWQKIQSRIQTFWKRYYLEYLNNLQQRHKWNKINANIDINDIVLIKEDNTPVCKWPFGRVVQVHPGKDGLVRAVTLKTSHSTIQRPVVKLCKLPVG